MLDQIQQLLDRTGILGARNRCRIFVSYRRRGEGAGYAGRLADRLVREFGDRQCFRDVDDIESGTDFVRAISDAVGACKVLVVVVAPDWLNATDVKGRRRLDDPRDFVRIEIAAALERDTRVVPVLVGGAAMPSPEQLPAALEAFARRQAHELSDTRWEYDVDQLVGAIERIGVKRVGRQLRQPARWMWAIPAATVGAGVVVWAAISAALNGAQTDEIQNTIATLAAAQTAASSTFDRAKTDDVESAAPRYEADDGALAVEATSYEPGPDAGASPQLEVSAIDAERPSIIEAMRRANEAERTALHELDTSMLSSAFTGEALETELAAVQDLMEAGVHAVNTLHAQRIDSIELSEDGTVAWVEAVETWSSEYHQNVTDACVLRAPAHDVPQTVRLERGSGGWIVAAIDIRADIPDAVACG